MRSAIAPQPNRRMITNLCSAMMEKGKSVCLPDFVARGRNEALWCHVLHPNTVVGTAFACQGLSVFWWENFWEIVK